MKTKVLVVPVYQKHWLWFTFSEATAAEAAAERAVHWTQGASLPEKAQLLGKEISYKFNNATQKQWKALQAAEEGSFRNRLYRLATWVLSQEDPTETFLKSLPRNPPEQLEVIHPASVKERLVRRRLRRMAQAQEALHSRRILGWALATIPQLPLVLTPLPNVTLYYTAYKMVSHYQAVQGCRTLRAAFDRYDREELERARNGKQQQQQQRGQGQGQGRGPLGFLPLPWLWGGGGGGGGRAGAGAGAPAAAGTRGAAASAGGGVGWGMGQGGGGGEVAVVPAPHFSSCRKLDKVVKPLERWETPLDDGRAAQLRDMFAPPAAAAAAAASSKKASSSGCGTSGAKQQQQQQQQQQQPGKGKQPQQGGAADEDSASSEGGAGAQALPELVARLRRKVLDGAAQGRGQGRGRA
ncbi:hypothetical protein HYH02_013521 [Chlamydomonas schloesseri]|uniref:Uncharacterized protein n=1 Tax=Chlamydomonas schloesseri TaxID=2026947 RepID=A0A835SPU6_9CHLO|nr:hypothetical protein HYH02_013521 [Chlamydomonas schloesseri]|eukprot:KAG2430989.1 hypothetical protein HYH02_013521 [Chlamydomonas schloesseri]